MNFRVRGGIYEKNYENTDSKEGTNPHKDYFRGRERLKSDVKIHFDWS
jgi:hypothetical protein